MYCLFTIHQHKISFDYSPIDCEITLQYHIANFVLVGSRPSMFPASSKCCYFRSYDVA